MKCLYCNKEIEGRNKKAKYCCQQHKVNHHQNLNTARRKWLEEEVVRLNKIIDILNAKYLKTKYPDGVISKLTINNPDSTK